MPEDRPTRPRSEAQRAAARRNGARSRGPVTAAGKARASRNAFRHGLDAAVHLLAPGEDAAALERLRAALLAEYRPDRPSRALLVERLATAVWKLRRAERLEAVLHGLPPRPPLGRLDPEPGLPAALTRLPELATLLRHQGRLERFLLRALQLLAAEPQAASEAEPPPENAAPTGPDAAPDGPTAEPEPAPDGQSVSAADRPAEPDHPPAKPGEPRALEEVSADGTAAEVPRGAAGVETADPAGPDRDRGPGASADPAAPPAAEPGAGPPLDLHALARASAARLLREGRPLEAARLARLLAPPGRARPGPEPASGSARQSEAAVVKALLATFDPETRALWDSVGYDSWVVPPGTGRRPMASLTAEWVCPADRWRVLEELRRLDDPAEHARVLAHWARAGLDPGDDHPFWRTEPVAAPASDPTAAAAPAAGPSAADPNDPAPDPAAPPRDEPDGPEDAEPNPELRRLLRRLGEEAEAYHAIGRERRAREAWLKHARELGVPLPPHADPPDGAFPRAASP